MENIMIEEPTRRVDMETEVPEVRLESLTILQNARSELLCQPEWNARSEFFYWFLCDAIVHTCDGRKE